MQANHDGKNWYNENGEEGMATAYRLAEAEPLYHEQTPFQTIDIYHTEQFGRLFVFDDTVMLSDADHFFYHEMITHPAMACCPDAQHVAIIGGGDCGSLCEILKYPTLASVTQIEIDERVTRIAEDYFPELCARNQDSRAHFVFDDGIAWIEQADPASLDIIIIDSTDPVGPAVGLFQLPFYQACIRALKPNGLLVQQSESPFLHLKVIRAMHQAMREAGFQQTDLLSFPQPCYPSGWWSVTMASVQPHDLNPRQEPAVDTRYYNLSTLQASKAQANFIKTHLK